MLTVKKTGYVEYTELIKDSTSINIFFSVPEDESTKDNTHEFGDVLECDNHDRVCMLIKDSVSAGYEYPALRLAIMNLKELVKTAEYKGKKTLIINRIQFISEKECEMFICTIKEFFGDSGWNLTVCATKPMID